MKPSPPFLKYATEAECSCCASVYIWTEAVFTIVFANLRGKCSTLSLEVFKCNAPIQLKKIFHKENVSFIQIFNFCQMSPIFFTFFLKNVNFSRKSHYFSRTMCGISRASSRTSLRTQWWIMSQKVMPVHYIPGCNVEYRPIHTRATATISFNGWFERGRGA